MRPSGPSLLTHHFPLNRKITAIYTPHTRLHLSSILYTPTHNHRVILHTVLSFSHFINTFLYLIPKYTQPRAYPYTHQLKHSTHSPYVNTLHIPQPLTPNPPTATRIVVVAAAEVVEGISQRGGNALGRMKRRPKTPRTPVMTTTQLNMVSTDTPLALYSAFPSASSLYFQLLVFSHFLLELLCLHPIHIC